MYCEKFYTNEFELNCIMSSAGCAPAPATPRPSAGSGWCCVLRRAARLCSSMCSAPPYWTSEEESPAAAPQSDRPPSGPPLCAPTTASWHTQVSYNVHIIVWYQELKVGLMLWLHHLLQNTSLATLSGLSNFSFVSKLSKWIKLLQTNIQSLSWQFSS